MARATRQAGTLAGSLLPPLRCFPAPRASPRTILPLPHCAHALVPPHLLDSILYRTTANAIRGTYNICLVCNAVCRMRYSLGLPLTLPLPPSSRTCLHVNLLPACPSHHLRSARLGQERTLAGRNLVRCRARATTASGVYGAHFNAFASCSGENTTWAVWPVPSTTPRRGHSFPPYPLRISRFPAMTAHYAGASGKAVPDAGSRTAGAALTRRQRAKVAQHSPFFALAPLYLPNSIYLTGTTARWLNCLILVQGLILNNHLPFPHHTIPPPPTRCTPHTPPLHTPDCASTTYRLPALLPPASRPHHTYLTSHRPTPTTAFPHIEEKRRIHYHRCCMPLRRGLVVSLDGGGRDAATAACLPAYTTCAHLHLHCLHCCTPTHLAARRRARARAALSASLAPYHSPCAFPPTCHSIFLPHLACPGRARPFPA